MPAARKALAKLLSRFELSDAQATRYFQPPLRANAGIALEDADIAAEPLSALRTRSDAAGRAPA